MSDTPASRVEEVLARIKGVKHNVGTEPRTYYLAEQADLDALIAAVRSDVRERLTAAAHEAAKLAIDSAMENTRATVLQQVRDRVQGMELKSECHELWGRGWEHCRHITLAALSDLAEGKP